MAGTIFQKTRMSLTLWFRAVWWVTAQENGASALGLQRILGLGQYKTALTWLHKLRRAMVRPGRDRLDELVEVDEIYVGGKASGALGRKLDKKALVAVAAEETGAGVGRVRLKRVPDDSAASLETFILEAVEPGSIVRTDGWRSYSKLQALGYLHEASVKGGDPDRIDSDFPRVRRVASLLKRWLLGTHQGAVTHKYLDYYLDEFTFRFNRRNSRSGCRASSSTGCSSKQLLGARLVRRTARRHGRWRPRLRGELCAGALQARNGPGPMSVDGHGYQDSGLCHTRQRA